MLEKKIRENQLIQNDVDRLRDREHALTCIAILREKKCWMVICRICSAYITVLHYCVSCTKLLEQNIWR